MAYGASMKQCRNLYNELKVLLMDCLVCQVADLLHNLNVLGGTSLASLHLIFHPSVAQARIRSDIWPAIGPR